MEGKTAQKIQLSELHQARSFKDNLKNILVKYSFCPALGMEIICILVVLCVSGLWGVSSSTLAGKEICQELDIAVAEYDQLLEQLAKSDNITDHTISSTRRTAIMKALYSKTVTTGYDAELYILDQDKNVVTSSREELSQEKQGEISRNWNVLEKIKEQPRSLQIEVSKGAERALFLGRAVEADGQLQGYVVCRLNSRVFDKLVADYAAEAMIVQGDHWILKTNGYQFVDPIGKLTKEMRDFQGIRIFEHSLYYVMHQQPLCGSLTVYTFFDYTDALRVLMTVFVTGMLVLFFLYFAGLANAEKMAVRATQDISALNDAFLEVAGGNLAPTLDIHSSTEFENIGQGFNQMINSLNTQMEENRELAKTVAYEQVKQLASQFKSHFLFNTLDNIRFICRLAPEMAENMVISLSELLRYNTGNPNEKVTIEEDLNYIKRYFDILKIRFGDAFSYQIQVEDDVRDALILKLLIQPLVENAVKYGFGGRDHMEIVITAERMKDKVCIVCRDDGEGIAPEQLIKIQENLKQEENKTPHLGLYNVHRRLQLMYGQEYGLSLENRDGLEITVIFPIQEEICTE